MSNKVIKDFKDMFDINEADKEIESSDNSDNTDNYESFDQLTSDISDSISECDKKGQQIEKKSKKTAHDVIKETCLENTSVEQIDEEIKETDGAIEDIDFETLSELKEEEPEKKEEKQNDKLEKMTKRELKEYRRKKYGSIIKMDWFLESPASLYDIFYDKKAELVYGFSGGEQLDFEQYNQELIDCSINISGEVFDKNLIQQQMGIIQQFKERVKVIYIKCNNQYFLWKRFVEILRGCLARVQYEKPIIKQEGLIHEHMRDIEWYFCKLESLHNNVNHVTKTLDSAYDCLSRKVSIAMELKPMERYQNYIIDNQIPNTNVDDFDVLPDKAEAKIDKKKSGDIGWDSIS